MISLRSALRGPTVDAQQVVQTGPGSSVDSSPVEAVRPAEARLAASSRLTRDGDIFLGQVARTAPAVESGSPFDTSEYFLMLGGGSSLTFGQRGAPVEILQRALMLVAEETGDDSLALKGCGVDGIYGMEVELAVRSLQRRVGREPTGNFGAAEAAQLLVVLSEAERPTGAGSPRSLGGLPALEAQFGLGELLETDQDPDTGNDVRVYTGGRVELAAVTGLPTVVERDGMRVPGAVVLRAMENGLGAFQQVNSDGFAQLHFRFEHGTVSAAGGNILFASRPAGAGAAIAEQLGLGAYLEGNSTLGRTFEVYAGGQLAFDANAQTLASAQVGEPGEAAELSAAVLEIALFRELGAFRNSTSETWDAQGVVTRHRFDRGSVIVDADGRVCRVQLQRSMPTEG